MIVLRAAFFSIFVLGFVQSERCFSCTGIDHPNNCTAIATCNVGEQCSVKQYVTAEGKLLYDVECLPQTTCQSLGNIFGKRDTRAVTDVTTCEECCTGDFCNNKGCGDTGSTPVGDRGPLCFTCDAAAGPNACTNVKFCEKGEECLLYLVPEQSTPNQYAYRSMCEPAAACAVISSLHPSSLCSPNCCSDDLCNDICASQAASCDTNAGWQQWTSATTSLCVKVHSEHANWDTARAKCQSEGGDLVVLDTVEKSLLARQEVIADANVNHQSGLWIGAKDFDSINQFRWVDNQLVVVANGDWDTNQPNFHDGGHEQDCATMWRTSSTTQFQWHDDWCDKPLAFICERW